MRKKWQRRKSNSQPQAERENEAYRRFLAQPKEPPPSQDLQEVTIYIVVVRQHSEKIRWKFWWS